jgi:RNA polymerase sigma factor (sigma-70 family)
MPDFGLEGDVSTGRRNDPSPLLRALQGDEAGPPDGQLLGQFVGRGDAAALDILVRRHGPMVWGVCRRLLRDPHDAEDAFQATFLVLVRRAASVRSPEALANWLYGVAHQTARKARATAARRRAREGPLSRAGEAEEPASAGRAPGDDLRPLLDRELSRLPGRYRVAIVLCDLEGKTRAEAAGQLGLPAGTVASRLARGRAMLARRLARRGLAVSGGSLGVALSQAAVVPARVSSAVVGLAADLVAGRTAAAPPGVAALTEGVLRDMLISKLKPAATILAVVVGVVLAVRGLTGASAPAQDRPPPRVDEPKAEPPPAAAVEGHEFAKAYQGNDAAGDERFLGKRVRMTGGWLESVKAVAAGPARPRSYLLILLVNPAKGRPSENPNWQPMHVAFQFGADSRKELAGLKPREWVEVEGSCEGRTGEFITFTDCKIVELPKH